MSCTPPPTYKFVFTVIFILFLILPSVSLFSQQHWSEEIFFSLSGQYYIIPPLSLFSPEIAERYGISKGIISYPGFRTSAGYMWRSWNFALETGFTYIKGDNPLVTKIYIVPLTIKAGYSFFPVKGYDRFNITPLIAAGVSFNSAVHYKDAIDILIDNPTKSKKAGFILQAGARFGWSPFKKLERKLELFVAISADLIIEKDGVIPLPQIELGVIYRPFLKRKAPNEIIIAEEIIVEEIITEEVIEEEIIVEEVVIEPEFKKQVFIIYFSPDAVIPTGNEIKALAQVAEIFGEYSEAEITIQGYAAPLSSSFSHTELSRRRAVFCEKYLTDNFSIPKEKIKTQWFGSAMPENTEQNDYPSRRSAVITIEGWIYP